MKVEPAAIPDVLVITPEVFSDARGFLYESYNERRFFELTGLCPRFVQDNHTVSRKDNLHGLHYQIEQTQAKLMRVVRGEVFDVGVDLRKRSRHFGRWTGAVLSAQNKKQMWIPAGFAHGFLVLSESAEILYKVTDYYAVEHERVLRWDDPEIGIHWPLDRAPTLSAKDQRGLALLSAETF